MNHNHHSPSVSVQVRSWTTLKWMLPLASLAGCGTFASQDTDGENAAQQQSAILYCSDSFDCSQTGSVCAVESSGELGTCVSATANQSLPHGVVARNQSCGAYNHAPGIFDALEPVAATDAPPVTDKDREAFLRAATDVQNPDSVLGAAIGESEAFHRGSGVASRLA
ncbi:MAG: hypothetical protein H6715_05590 [Myxococcales bacterium]|nr:hypothetical protein [Myxococcales bacterium]MCB9707927.1 hypothetical protein [Myxococcales bacterium]